MLPSVAVSTGGRFADGLVGVVLDGRYRLDAVLGEGGMGSVFRAHHLAMDRKVAVKLLKPHLTQDATALERFMREARVTLKIDSPHAVKVLDFGITPHGDYYMALEYLDGRTVQRELDVDGPFAPARVIHIARQALSALGAAHRGGLVHRDIKPDNILLMRVGDDPDYAKLLDFGVAKLMEGATASDRSRMALTQAGMVFGTPEFMSPEQACGHALDGRSDLYSLAATMFAMLTGCALFEAASPIEFLTHHVRTPPPHLEVLVPELGQFPELDALMQRCLAKRREQRPQSAEELEQLLAQLAIYVERGGGTVAPARRADTPQRGTHQASSSYIQALPQDLVDPGATLPDRPSSVDRRAAVSGPAPVEEDESDLPPLRRGRRGLVLALGAAVTLGVVVTALGLAASHRASGSQVATAPPTDAPPRVVDAGVSLDDAAPSPDAPALPDDAGVLHGDGGTAVPNPRHPPRPPRPNTEALEHLRAAEEALQVNNRLRQLVEADLALQADPRSVRAKYLLADALIKGGDLDRGCAHLRALGRYALAVARASVANCPR